MPVQLGKAAQELRQKLGLTVRAAADELEISYPHLSNIENDKASPSPEVINRFFDKWGIDLYMYAIAFHGDDRVNPDVLAAPLKALAEGFRIHIERVLKKREGGRKCSTSED